MTIKAIVNKLFGRHGDSHTHKVDNTVIRYDWTDGGRHIWTVTADGRTIYQYERLDRFGNWKRA